MVAWGRVCFSSAGGFDSGSSFLAARLNRLVRGKRVVSKPWWLGVGSVFRLRVVSTRAARSSLPGSTSFEVVKSVEPILTSFSERVVLTPSCRCRNVAAGFVRYDSYLTSSPMWVGLLATLPSMCCMSSVPSSVASGVAGSQEVAV